MISCKKLGILLDSQQVYINYPVVVIAEVSSAVVAIVVVVDVVLLLVIIVVVVMVLVVEVVVVVEVEVEVEVGVKVVLLLLVAWVVGVWMKKRKELTATTVYEIYTIFTRI